jgi:peptide/nickel transport system substrate-binding protein
MGPKLSRRHFVGGAAALSALAPLGIVPAFSQEHQSFIARVDRDVENLDPAFRTSLTDSNVIRVVYQRLIDYNVGAYGWQLDAAEAIEQKSDLEITFRLKQGIMFTGGYGEMTADDVKFSLERFAFPDAEGRVSSYRQDWADLKEVVVHDKYSGSIIFERPAPNIWQSALPHASGAIVSRKAVEKFGAQFGRNPVGSGRYEVVSFSAQDGVVLKRNPLFLDTPGEFESFTVRFISNVKTAQLAVEAGEIDFTQVPLTTVPELERSGRVAVSVIPTQKFIWLGLNTESPKLADIKVRQAIRAAVNIDEVLLGAYQGRAPRLNTLLPAGLAGHWAEAPVYTQDLQQAQALLAEANVSGPLKVKLTVLNEPVFNTIALIVQAQLAAAGIEVEIDQREGGSFWSAGKDESGENMELYITSFNTSVAPVANTRWFLPNQIGDWNWSRWNSPEFEELYDSISVDFDIDSRSAKLIEMQRLMDESAAFIWLTSDVVAYAHQTWLVPMILPNGVDCQYAYFRRA